MQTPIETPFNKDTTAEEALGSIDLTGKLAVITGGSTGIGKETARVLAKAGADIFIGARDVEKLETARNELAANAPGKIYSARLDLMEPASANEFADAVLELNRPIDLLINNAGVMATPLKRNSLGMEMQYATNYVGHAIITSRLAPALVKAGESRLVSLSSLGHQFSPPVLDDLNFNQREYDKFASYGQSKTGNILLAVKVAKELGDKGVTALAVHPGMIETELTRYMSQEELEAATVKTIEGSGQDIPIKTIPQGAATTVWAATAPEFKGKGPLYLEDCRVARIVEEPNMTDGVLPYALDEELAEALWQKTEELLGQSLPF